MLYSVVNMVLQCVDTEQFLKSAIRDRDLLKKLAKLTIDVKMLLLSVVARSSSLSCPT